MNFVWNGTEYKQMFSTRNFRIMLVLCSVTLVVNMAFFFYNTLKVYDFSNDLSQIIFLKDVFLKVMMVFNTSFLAATFVYNGRFRKSFQNDPEDLDLKFNFKPMFVPNPTRMTQAMNLQKRLTRFSEQEMTSMEFKNRGTSANHVLKRENSTFDRISMLGVIR
jgi:hypothetical protein